MSKIKSTKPFYKNSPIYHIESLSNTLGLQADSLIDMSRRTSDHYYSFEKETKPGKTRNLNEPKEFMKKLQKRINKNIFENVTYPNYMQGSIKDKNSPRSYITNATIHSESNILISIDISDFYNNITTDHVKDIFMYFFKFPEKISALLAELLTLNGRVPQGGVCSSYIANLVFHDREYKIVSEFKKQNLRYTRLLDDITISSKSYIPPKKLQNIKSKCIEMIKSKKFKVNNKKTKVVSRRNIYELMFVTGLWVNNSEPKLSKLKRKEIRFQVHLCEKKYLMDNYSDSYHKLWNSTSGKIAQMESLKHSQAKSLRSRLNKVLPLLDNDETYKLEILVRDIIKVKGKRNTLNYTKKYNKAVYKIGILSRSNQAKAKYLKAKLSVIKPQYTYEQFWEAD